MAMWQFKNLDEARSLIASDPIGSPSVDFKPIELGITPNQSFDSAAGAIAINARGKFTIAVLNDKADVDEDGLLQAEGSEVADGQLPPQVLLDSRAWLKLRAEAGVKASTATTALEDLIGVEVGVDGNIVFVDYRVHDRSQSTRDAFLNDILHARFVTNRDDVLALTPGSTLAFRRAGTLQTSVSVNLSDMFTGQIGALGKVLGTTAPIAFSFQAGARISADVRVSDDFLIAISRISETEWRAGFRKARTRRIAPTVEAGISVGLSDPAAVESLLIGALDSVIGAPLAQVEQILQHASLETLGALERRVAMFVMERLGLEPAFATLEALRERIDDLKTRFTDTLTAIIETRISVSFAYEYVRIKEPVNLLQVTLDRAAVERLHADLVAGRTVPVTESIANQTPGVKLEAYLNQKSVLSEHSWGFTLGFGKWTSLGGRDYRKMHHVQRFAVDGGVQESYLGARGYRGSWVGETFEWSVDLRADMKTYVREPLVNDFTFGVHLAWLAQQRSLSPQELDAWLDSAAIWRVLTDSSVSEIRQRLEGAIDADAEVSVHLTVPNSVFRSILPRLAAASPEQFAGALAAAMPWMDSSEARANASRRRLVYGPLWATALQHPELRKEELAKLAAERLKATGHTEMVTRETALLNSSDPFSFAGLTRINGDTRAVCQAFSRGAAILQSAIDSGARNRQTIDKAFEQLNDLWAQSHHVRAVGVHLLDHADSVGQLSEVTRTLIVRSAALGADLVVTM
jgi:hypothetical protein